MDTQGWRTNKKTMKTRSINIPKAYDNLIGQMKDFGLTPSRSEFIRNAIWEKLSRDFAIMRSLIDEKLELPEKRDVFEHQDYFTIDNRVWNKK